MTSAATPTVYLFITAPAANYDNLSLTLPDSEKRRDDRGVARATFRSVRSFCDTAKASPENQESATIERQCR
jgi:hypothetical protein